jgi:hypothetical protein
MMRSVQDKRIWGVVALTLACRATPDANQAVETRWALPALAPEEGLSIRLPEIVVPAGREEQTCFFVKAPDLNGGQDFWVDRVRVAMNPGSHHLNVFRVRTLIDLRPDDGAPIKLGSYDATVVYGHQEDTTNPCWKSANWADWPLVANSQHSDAENPYSDWQLPDGVAMRFSPGEVLMVQSHYVNTTTQPAPFGGSAGINFYRSKIAQPQELGTLFATQQSIRICHSNPTPTFSGTCHLPAAATVVAANGHFHSRGRDFRMYSWDGHTLDHPAAEAEFYQSAAWDHPLMKTDIDRAVADGGGVWWDCAYQWKKPQIVSCGDVNAKDPEHAEDCCYTFGGNTDLGEHCNVFLYYYPKAANSSDVFCN